MKPLQYFLKARALLVRNSKPSCFSKGLLERVRNCCMSMLMLLVAGHSVALKFKNIYERNVLVAKESVQILRIFFVAGRNLFYDDCQGLLIQVKGIAPDLCAQINTTSMPSGTVVSIFLQFLPF